MSLILEALRKSEAERQIGRAPGLLTPMPILRPPRRRRRWAGAALLVLVVLSAALGGAWWLGRNGAAQPPEAAGAPTGPGNLASAPATTAPAVVEAEPPPRPAAVAPARPTPVPRETLPAVGPADQPSDPDFASTERESLPIAPPTATAPADPPAAAPAAPAPAPTRSAAEPTPLAAAAPAAAPEEWLPPLRSLSEAERGGLPPLRMSMHVYNDDPARRFVLIDGRRRVEGEQLADGVRISRIRRDGAELDLRGRRILLERP